MRNNLIDLLFPRFCLGCGYLGTYICSLCESKMKKVGKPLCFYCNKPSFLGLTHTGCHKDGGIDGCLSLYLYGDLFKKLLLISKYKGAHIVLSTLLAFFQQNLTQDINKWNNLFHPTVMSVPLHPQRIRERGFNQSDTIISRYFETTYFLNEKLLERLKNTNHLAAIGNKLNRKKHIRGAFTFMSKAVPKSALLVDDVITTGSTILECSKVLKKSGVQTVLAFSLARGKSFMVS